MIGDLWSVAPAAGPGEPGDNPLHRLSTFARTAVVADLVAEQQWADVEWLLRLETANGTHAVHAARERDGDIEGFAADLRLALTGTVHSESDAATLRRACLYALSLGSLMQSAFGIGPQLLRQLVHIGSWPVSLAVAYAARKADPQARVDALIAVVDDVPEAEFAAYAETLLTAVSQVPARVAPLAEVLRAATARRADDVSLMVVRRTATLLEPSATACLVATIASWLDPDTARQWLVWATDAGAAFDVRATLARRLPPGECDQFVSASLAEPPDVANPYPAAVRYAALADIDRPDVRAYGDRVRVNAMTAPPTYDTVTVLTRILPWQPADVQRRIVDHVLRWRPPAMMGPFSYGPLAAHLHPAVLPLLVAGVRARHADQPLGSAPELARIAPFTTGELRTQIVDELVRDLADRRASEVPLWTADELADIAPLLDDRQFDAALTTAREVPWFRARATALAHLARASASRRPEVVDEALGLAERIPDADVRIEVLDLIAPALSGRRLDRAVRSARTLHDAPAALDHLPAMVASMSAAGRTQAWTWLIRSTDEELDVWRRIRFLGDASHLLPATVLPSVRDLALTTANDQLRARGLTVVGDFDAALATMHRLSPVNRCQEYLFAARRTEAPHLRYRLLALVEATVSACPEARHQVGFLCDIAALSDTDDRDRLLREALAKPVRDPGRIIPTMAPLMSIWMARTLLTSTSDEFPLGFDLVGRTRRLAVAALLRRCSAEDDGWLDRYLADYRSDESAWDCAEAASGLPDNRALPLLHRALQLLDTAEPASYATGAPDEWWDSAHAYTSGPGQGRDYVLSAVAARMAPIDPELAISVLDDIRERVWRLRALIAVCGTAAVTDVAGRTVDTALSLASHERRVAGFAALSAVLARHPAASSEVIRDALIRFLASRGRADGLPVCLAAGPLWALWGGGQQAADDVFEVVVRVTGWWP